jgi:putative OmpL-like beta-barrel porin-2
MAFFVMVIAVFSLIAAPAVVSAQTAETPSAPAELSSIAWQYGGFVDVGTLFSSNSPANHLFRNRGTTPRVDELDLNMTAAYVRKLVSETSRAGIELTVQAGRDSETFGFSATAPNIGGADWLRHLGPANVSYLAPIGQGLTVQGGIFSSLIGYDSLYARDNFNYTRPWTGDYTPYLMLGVNASYPLTARLTAAGLVVNGYWHLAHANDVPSFGGQLAYKATDQVTVKETVLYGPHQSNTALDLWRFFSDTIVERKKDRLTVGGEYQIGTEGVDVSGNPRALWMAAQLPVHWTLGGPWSATARPELAWDRDGRWIGSPQSVKAVTTTLEYRAACRGAGAIVRLEYRYDDSRGPGGGFFDGGDVRPGVAGLTPGQHLFGVGMILTLDRTVHQ